MCGIILNNTSPSTIEVATSFFTLGASYLKWGGTGGKKLAVEIGAKSINYQLIHVIATVIMRLKYTIGTWFYDLPGEDLAMRKEYPGQVRFFHIRS